MTDTTNNTAMLPINLDNPQQVEAAASFFNHLVELNGGFKVLEGKSPTISTIDEGPELQNLAPKPDPVADAPEEDTQTTTTSDQPAQTATEAASNTDPDEYPVERNGVMVDKQGVVWDARIHSGNKKCRKKDGIWTPKRGVDDAEYERITAELLALANGEAPQQEQEQEQAVEETFDPGNAFNAGQQQQQAATGGPDMTTAEFFQTVSQNFTAKQQAAVCAEYGWQALSNAVPAKAAPGNEQLFTQVIEKLNAVKAQGV